MKISLFHPFTAKAIGFEEEDLYDSHSMPHQKALLFIQKKKPNYKLVIEYFTLNFLFFSKVSNDLEKRFWPITNYKKRGVWRSEKSFIYLLYNFIKPSDLTIINFSGHGSKFVFRLANNLKYRKKKYITMIGGMHMSLKGAAYNYYKNASFIIVHTNIQKKEIQKNASFKNMDIRVLPLGVDTSIFKPLDIKNNLVDNEFNLLYVGRITRLKQIEIAINTVSDLKSKGLNGKLNLIGPISDANYYNELLSLIDVLKINDQVNFKGKYPQAEILNFYQKADLLLLPSKHESFGMVVTEAMACGTPVISLRGSGGPEEIIQNNEDGIITNKEYYSSSIIKLLQNKEIFNAMSVNCVKNVEKKWSQQVTSKLMLSYLEELE